MSVRAYNFKVNYNKTPTFNLWHDKWLMNLLDEMGGFEYLDMDGCGYIEISNKMWEKIKKKYENKLKGTMDKDEKKWAENIIKQIKKDIEKAMKQRDFIKVDKIENLNKDDEVYTHYYCF